MGDSLGRWHMTRPSKRLMARFQGRTDIGRDRALADLAAGLPPAQVSELTELLDIELGIPLGLLRGDDRLDVILAPFPLGNPFSWLWAEGALEDGISEINYQLKLRGVTLERRPETVRDLFAVWCRKPAA